MKVSPLMEQYFRLKEKNKDSVLFFRLGDFYEMFEKDAIEVSALLNLTLTHRVDTPMCGVPYHAATSYIKRLLDAGKKVAICEQVGTPSGTLMERKVVRLITPGTVVDEDFLNCAESNYIMAFYSVDGIYYTCRADISLGNFFVRSFETFEALLSFISFCKIKEVVVSDDDYFTDKEKRVQLDGLDIIVNKLPYSSFNVRSGIDSVKECLGSITVSFAEIPNTSMLWGAVAGLFDYFKTLGIDKLISISCLKSEGEKDTLLLDESSLQSLEIVKSSSDGSSTKSLFGVLNRTSTSMGARLLKERLISPLRSIEAIEERLNRVEYFISNADERNRVKNLLMSVYDIERLNSIFRSESIKKFQLLRLSKSLIFIRQILNGHFKDYAPLFKYIDKEHIAALFTLGQEIDATLDDDITSKVLIKKGIDSTLDEYRMFIEKGDEILNAYVEEQKEITGIQNLRLGKSKLYGYTLDVTPAGIPRVPSSWIEKQSLVSGKRYITERLKELEKEKERSAFDAERLEKSLYNELALKVNEKADDILHLALGVKELDFFISLAIAAVDNNYMRPKFTTTGELKLQNARHPIVEKFSEKGRFVPNSIDVNTNSNSFLLITGPNMAGKSTYLRQNALLIIMAQLGSFVSADEAIITPVDRIFSRLGFNDNIAQGESTFLVEMKETASILRLSTKDSFVILDEIGRGTGSDDGRAIAESIMHFMARRKIKTLFATHYLQLAYTELEKNITPLTLEVEEKNGNVRFLRRVIKGVASSSYGIHVARLAGVPESVLKEAEKSLRESKSSDPMQFYSHTLFDSDDDENDEVLSANADPRLLNMKDDIENFDVNNSTPFDAMLFIKKLQEELKG